MNIKSHLKTIKLIINRYDLILFIILVVLSALFYNCLPKNYKTVEIIYKSELVYTADLDIDKIITIDEGIVAEIKSGKIRLINSTCPNKFCVKQGWTNSFPIICVPNKLIIRIVSKKQSELLITS